MENNSLVRLELLRIERNCLKEKIKVLNKEYYAFCENKEAYIQDEGEKFFNAVESALSYEIDKNYFELEVNQEHRKQLRLETNLQKNEAVLA